MRRITLTDAVAATSDTPSDTPSNAPSIARQAWPLACDIAIVLTGEDGREIRRRYTVRAVQGDRLVVDAVLHGHGPGSSWASAAAVGDEVTFYGPRGVVDVPEASWYWALTDEAGLPAIAAVAETLNEASATATASSTATGSATATAGSLTVLAEISDEAERYPFPEGVTVHWLPRGTQPPGHPDLIASALAELAAAGLPEGAGYGYVLGESRAIVALRDELGRHGLGREHVYAKGYWNLNSRRTR